jgi:hypothetical protein
MGKENNILVELAEIAPLVAGINKSNVYQVPSGYFDSLSDKIVESIQIPHFFNASIPYKVPPNYFESLADNIINKIHNQKHKVENSPVANELNEIAPLLNTINKQNVFFVPDNYFNEIKISDITKKAPAKVVTLGGNVRKWVTYVAAASILFIIATGSFFYVDRHAHKQQVNLQQKLASLKEEEIISYLKDDEEILSGDLKPEEQSSKIQVLLKNTSDEEIENYLNDYSDAGEKNIKGI